MKKRTLIICSFLLLLMVSLAGLSWWQRENLEAVKNAASHTSGELEEQLAENQQALQNAVDASPEVTVRDLTEEERQGLRDGSMTQEEVTNRLVEPVKPADEPSAPVQTTQTVDEAAQKALSETVAKVYVLREEFTIKLDDMYEAAKAEYIAMPEEERTKTNLAKLTSRYLAKASELEKECDRNMDQIIASMEEQIRKNGGDKTLPEAVFQAYVNEKSLKKSWYMSKLQEKGLI